MVGGGLLVLGGVLTMGLLVYQNRRATSADDTQTNLPRIPFADAPTLEQPRVPMPES
jgi:hypothetical protein